MASECKKKPTKAPMPQRQQHSQLSGLLASSLAANNSTNDDQDDNTGMYNVGEVLRENRQFSASCFFATNHEHYMSQKNTYLKLSNTSVLANP